MLKQPFRGVLRKRYSKNMQQICKATLLKLHFGKGAFLANLLHIFRTPFLKEHFRRAVSVLTDELVI